MVVLSLVSFLVLKQVAPTAPESPLAQKARFHPAAVGMSSDVRQQAYIQRRANQSSSVFKNVSWRSIGSIEHGGRIVELKIPQDVPNRLFMGYATGGLWVSDNDGYKCKPIFDNQGHYGIGSFDVTKDGKTIWVGTGENNSQRTSYAGTGMYASHDGGETWSYRGLPESHHVGKVLIHPTNPSEVWVGVLGHLYFQNKERGVYKTTDNGKTWQHILSLGEWTGVVDLAMDPRDPKTVYAAAWERDRRTWDLLESGVGSAIYKTTDAGKTWSKLTALPHGADLGRPSVAIAPSDPDRVYVFLDHRGPLDAPEDEFRPSGVITLNRFAAMTATAFQRQAPEALKPFLTAYLPKGLEAEVAIKQINEGKVSQQDVKKWIEAKSPKAFELPITREQFWRSDDGGRSWEKLAPTMGSHGGYYWDRVYVNPKNPDDVYTTGVLLLRSKDGGESWKPVAETEHVDFHAVAWDPRDDRRVFVGQDGGLSASGDGGETYRSITTIAVGQYTTIAVDNRKPYQVIGGLQDNGTWRGPSNFVIGRSDPSLWKSISGGDGSAIAIDPRENVDTVYTAFQFGGFIRNDFHLKATQFIQPRNPQGVTNRWNWIAPLVLSPFHPDIVFAGSQMVYRSFDQGRTWQPISGDLTKNLPNGNVPYSTLTQIAPSTHKFERLYVAADDGTIQTTPDMGVTWKNISTPAKDRWVTRLIASKHVDGRIYASQNGYRHDDWTPLVWASDDHGATWKSIASNLPFEPVNTVREDPDDANTLYVGTDMGVYVSIDRGLSWFAYGDLLDTPVHDLAIQARDKEMVVATHARSVWAVSTEPIQFARKQLDSKATLTIDGVRDLTGAERWGYERLEPWEAPENNPRNVKVTVWSDRAGTGEISIRTEKDYTLTLSKVKLDRGLNYLQIPLLLAPGSDSAIPRTPIDPNDPVEAIQDPFEARRPKYVPPGSYVLMVAQGDRKATATFKISK